MKLGRFSWRCLGIILIWVWRRRHVQTKCSAPVEKYEEESKVGTEETLSRGFLLQWISSDCSACAESGGQCGFDDSNYHFQCYCPDRPHAQHCIDPGGGQQRLKLLIGLGASGSGICVLIILAFCFRKRLSSNNTIIFWKKTTENYRNIEDFLRNYGSLAPKRYSYADIKKMTNSFKHKLGQGGYGGVYKGKLLDGRDVAVKVLNEAKGNGEDFINEVASISRTSHVNIVTLFGFCFEGRRRALIYEFVPNGSLAKFISEKNPLEADHKLNWETLHNITVGIARGLEYLHRGCSTRILHFDIKPHNILLDKDFCPKISDFGLAKICPRKESIVSMTGARGTPGYIAPEVFCRNFGDVSHKSDVYSYGMMVFEMTGRKNNAIGNNCSSDIYFPDWVYKRRETDEELVLQGIENEDDKEMQGR
ncbi:Receptor-like protein kinase [Melia azedarach]|uniref:Receptor-like protein kinase n=1 Tax=Melia azedarach TaxID=155640 RepID=A0ACC1XEZ7_MELAZ|nr:Receptor-like protein kinase [Melia azedarach]